jgi:aspartyl/asparaginyl-tRNA synthetase
MIQFVKAIPNESIIDIEAQVTKPEQAVESCSQKVEL